MLSLTFKKQQGVGMIELLSSLLILSVGVLGISTLQAKSMQFNQGAIYESRAAILANDILDRIRANPTQVNRYRIQFNDPAPSSPDCDGASSNCSLTQLSDYDLAAWRDELDAVLPNGNGQIEQISSAGGVTVVIVTVQYTDDRAEQGTAYGQANGTIPKQTVVRSSI